MTTFLTKSKLLSLILFFFLAAACSNVAIAQEESATQTATKTMTITIKMTDEDGNTQVKKIVKMGDEATEANAESIVDEQIGDFDGDVEVNVNIEENTNVVNGEMDGNQIGMEVTVDEEGNVFINDEPVEEGDNGERQVIIIQSEDSEGMGNIQDMLIQMDIDVNLEEMIENSDDGETEIRIVKKIITSEETTDGSGFLGVLVEEVEAVQGVKITEVVAGSAAEKAGLQTGDIIKTINGEAVENHTDLVTKISANQANEAIQVGFARGNQPMSKDIVLGKRTDHNRKNVYKWKNDNNWKEKMDCAKSCEGMSKEECIAICGFDCSKKKADCKGMSKEERFMRGMDCTKKTRAPKPRIGVTIEETNGTKGVLVENVMNDSPAQKGGLQVNDIITKVGKVKVNSVNELIQAVRAHQVGDQVRVQYLRNGKKQKSTLTLDAKPQRNARFKRGCCAPNTTESTSEKRIIIKKMMDENGNIVEETMAIDAPEMTNTLALETIDLFPNPTSENINIKFQTTEKTAIAVRIVDVTGKEIFSKEIPNFDGNFNETINLKGNAEGIYFLNINQGGKVFTEQIILNN